jgi:hypothetical protein
MEPTANDLPSLAMKYSEAQLNTIGVLNTDLEVGCGRIPPKVLGAIAEVFYFRNLDISALDLSRLLSRLLSDVSSPTRRENVKKSLKNTTPDLQRKIWRKDWFLERVRNHVPSSAARRTYGALPHPEGVESHLRHRRQAVRPYKTGQRGGALEPSAVAPASHHLRGQGCVFGVSENWPVRERFFGSQV